MYGTPSPSEASPVPLSRRRERTPLPVRSEGTARASSGYRGYELDGRTSRARRYQSMVFRSPSAKYFGFAAKTSFEEGLRKTIDWYRRAREVRPSSS